MGDTNVRLNGWWTMGPRTEMSEAESRNGFRPEITVLYCRHCVDAAADLGMVAQVSSRFSARLKMLACASQVEESHLLKLLANGADGVLVVGCPNRGCERLTGVLRAENRIERLRGYLQEIGMGEERLCLERGANFSGLQLLLLADRRAQAVRPLGPNPLRKGERP